MYIATAEQAKAADRYTIQDMGIPSLVLMETAANRILDICPPARTAVIFCGGGNNGGDGFCLGRLLALRQTKVTLIRLCPPEKMTPDAKKEYDLALRFGIPVISLEEAWNIQGADLIIDAMLGTGQTGAPKEPIASAVLLYNQMNGYKIAVDLPTGIHSDTGQVYFPAAKADLTVCLGTWKYGVLLGEGQTLAGKVLCQNIGIPKEAIDKAQICGTLVDASVASGMLPTRSLTAHKYSCGSIFIFSGSVGMTGAPTLAAMGAMKSGAGLVTVGVPSCVAEIIASKLTEPLILPLPDSGVSFDASAGTAAQPHMKKSNAAVIGPGIKNTDASDTAMRDFIASTSCPLVMDAGALPWISHRSLHDRLFTVITPHAGEAAKILGQSVATLEADRIRAAQALAETTGCIAVLKGHPTVTATPNGHIFVNTTGNPGMATGGTGDVLTGIIASLIGQGISTENAAVLGVYLHGLAGDLAAEKKGQWGLCATDVAEAIPEAMLITQRKKVSL